MIRADASPDAAYVAVVAAGDGHLRLRWREKRGELAQFNRAVSNESAPVDLRLGILDDHIIAEISLDGGANWKVLGGRLCELDAGPPLIGVFTSTHRTGDLKTDRAEGAFQDLRISPHTSSNIGPVARDITLMANETNGFLVPLLAHDRGSPSNPSVAMCLRLRSRIQTALR